MFPIFCVPLPYKQPYNTISVFDLGECPQHSPSPLRITLGYSFDLYSLHNYFFSNSNLKFYHKHSLPLFLTDLTSPGPDISCLEKEHHEVPTGSSPPTSPQLPVLSDLTFLGHFSSFSMVSPINSKPLPWAEEISHTLDLSIYPAIHFARYPYLKL